MQHSNSVTVIIPCYNVGKYIASTLDSLLNQSFNEFSVICLDDASKDNTFEILSQYSLSNKRIRSYRNETNLGVIKTLNKLVEMTSTTWILRMDSDDIFESTRVEELMKLTSNSQMIMASTAFSYIDQDSGPLYKKDGLDICTLNQSIRFMAMLNSPMPSQALFHRDVFADFQFDNRFSVAEDYYFFTKVLMNNSNKSVFNIDEKLYRYRINPNGLTSNNQKLMSENHYQIAKEYTQNILEIENKTLSYLKIALKLVDLKLMTGKDISLVFKDFFQMKDRFLQMNCVSINEKKEIDQYSYQYFIYLLFSIFKSSEVSIGNKIKMLLKHSPKIIVGAFKTKNLKWILKSL
ncbi:Chondroitin polymerase [Elizabethkingia anophelis]|uniref:Chondroitin polymerase n=2 Tax=Elizabethkingia TaxID=308865 RepID=A0A7Z7LVD7_9FLAO|nr:Chondroitin polymerase [Elizabethkingia anophelis]